MSAGPDLRDMAMRYARALDAHENERMYDLFVEEGSVRGVRRAFIGREAVARIPDVLAERYASTMHFVGNVLLLKQDDHRALGETYCLAHHFRNRPEGAGEIYVMGIRYQDTLVRTDDGWRFAMRNLVVDWEETRGCAFPPEQIKGEEHG